MLRFRASDCGMVLGVSVRRQCPLAVWRRIIGVPFTVPSLLRRLASVHPNTRERCRRMAIQVAHFVSQAAHRPHVDPPNTGRAPDRLRLHPDSGGGRATGHRDPERAPRYRRQGGPLHHPVQTQSRGDQGGSAVSDRVTPGPGGDDEVGMWDPRGLSETGLCHARGS